MRGFKITICGIITVSLDARIAILRRLTNDFHR